MKKIALISLIFLLVIVIVVGCKGQESKSSSKTSLSELQIDACNSADAAKTCDTRLPEVGIVLKEDCCKVLGKCC